MDNRRGLWLLLLVLLLLVPLGGVSAQTILLRGGREPAMPMPRNQSHHDLPGGLDGNNAEEMLAQRFRELQQLHQLQDQMQDLLKDENFVNNLKQQFDEKQLRELQEKIRHGEDLRGNGAWDRLLSQAASRGKLDQQQIKMLRGLLERSSDNQQAGSIIPPVSYDSLPSKLPPTNTGSSPDESLSSVPAQPAEKTFLERIEEGSEQWLSEHMEGLSDDFLRALTEMGAADEGAPLAELMRNMKKQTDLSSDDLAESATGLSRYWPKIGEFLNERRGTWNEMRSIFREVSTPSLPGLGSGSVPSSVSAPSADGASWSAAALTLATLGVFLLLVWKTGRWSRSTKAGGSDDWRLGSWPVAPDAVTTRQDLIRAFEYLALLCLGRRASTCNHRELAVRLTGQDAANPARRQAVEVLTWLYEQARYAPAGEVLSPGELSDARHALGYLAGVTVA